LIIESAKFYFPDIPVVENQVNGSGDPFIIIDKKEIDKLKDWHTLIYETLMDKPYLPTG
jgi:hypothetical protein